MHGTINREWVRGLPDGFGFVLRVPAAGYQVDGLFLGRTWAEAVEGLAEFNAARAEWGLPQVRVPETCPTR